MRDERGLPMIAQNEQWVFDLESLVSKIDSENTTGRTLRSSSLSLVYPV